MTGRELLRKVLTGMDDIDKEIVVDIVYRGEDGAVDRTQKAPAAWVSFHRIIIEASQICEREN